MAIKAIFFDFDLTLVDTGKIGVTIYRVFSKRAGLKPTEKGYDAYMGRRISENAENFAKNEKERKQLLNLFFKIHFKMIPQIKIFEYIK
jgi:phosphoglycolate phosphatase-like HAD superfamily hydrolase